MRFVAIVAAAGLVAGSAFGVLSRQAVARNPTAAESAARPDIGTGERLLLVIAGEYATRAQADAAAAGIVLGDLQGFVVAATSDFEGMTPGRYLVMSAFRTAQGAAEFEELVTMAGYGPMRRAVAVYRGSSWIGLGQEASPDGSGPLRGPLAPPEPNP
ncbi:MAG TPA: hypothetical protein VM841_08870 [Actinomycetota bacterium]|nr:hypothetical protein [Actinomycetota bacterium]